MTDEAQTIIDPAAVPVDASAAAPVPEVTQTTEASVDPVSEAADAAAADAADPDPVEPTYGDPELVTDESSKAYHHYSNPNAVRGVPAGPAPHPRTI